MTMNDDMEQQMTELVVRRHVPEGARVVFFARRPGGTELRPGETLWEDVNTNQLKAQLRQAKNRGWLIDSSPMRTDAYGSWIVVRLTEQRPADKLWISALVMGLAALVGTGIMVWHSRTYIAAILTTLAGIAIVAGIVRHCLTTSGQQCECILHPNH